MNPKLSKNYRRKPLHGDYKAEIEQKLPAKTASWGLLSRNRTKTSGGNRFIRVMKR
jgi:hypothetical protein